MMIIHILVDTSQIPTQDEDTNRIMNLIILYDQQQIYLHLVLQDQNSSNNYINI